MISLTTAVKLPSAPPSLSYGQAVMSLGSCFSQSIASKLREGALDVLVNPFGIQYNPLSIASALERILEGRPFTTEELIEAPQGYASLMHHGSFTRSSRNETLEQINAALSTAYAQLQRLDYLLLTWGTSYVYHWGATGKVVSNCHKLPEHFFTRKLADHTTLLRAWQPLLERLLELRPALQIITTVSPIRHLRDGAQGNSLSKAMLRIFTEELRQLAPQQIHYFPAYELMTDELRDYRFYAEDLVHPSPLAERIIAERFEQWLLSPEAQSGSQRAARLLKELRHRPLGAASAVHTERLELLEQKLQLFYSQYPQALDLRSVL